MNQEHTLLLVLLMSSHYKIWKNLWNYWRKRTDFINVCVCACLPSCVQLFATPWTVCICSLPGSSVHWIFLSRILKWVAISYSSDLINIVFSISDDILLSAQSFLINLNTHLTIILNNLSFLDKREFLRATEVISRTSFLSAFWVWR